MKVRRRITPGETKRVKNKTIFSLLLVFLLIGCGSENIVWTEIHNFSGSVWKGNDVIIFVPDSASLSHDRGGKGILCLRYAEDVSLGTLPVVVDMEWPEAGIYRADTLVIKLNPEENLTGINRKHGIFEVCDTVTLDSPPDPGWRMAVRQLSPSDEVRGIFSIIFTLEP